MTQQSAEIVSNHNTADQPANRVVVEGDYRAHVRHVQLKRYGFHTQLIFTFVFLLVSLADFVGSQQDYYQTEDKETLCNPVYDLWQ